jgi:hypothetical protein
MTFDILSGNSHRGPNDIRLSKTERFPHSCPARTGVFLTKRAMFSNVFAVKTNPAWWKGGFSKTRHEIFNKPLYNEWQCQVMRNFDGSCFIMKQHDRIVCVTT